MRMQRKRRQGYSKRGGMPQSLLGVMQRHNTDTLMSDFAVACIKVKDLGCECEGLGPEEN